MTSFLDRMNMREKILAAIVAGAFSLIICMALIKFVMEKQATLRSQLVTKQGELNSLQILAAERETWAARDQWIDASQPKLTNQSGAGVRLLDEVKQIAQDSGVMLENPAIGLPEIKEVYQSMPVTVETKSSWESLVKFLQALQSPGRFLAIENIEVKVDGSDKSKMHGTLRIARWYAPGEG